MTAGKQKTIRSHARNRGVGSFLLYTAVFAVTTAAVLMAFLVYRKTLIWGSDGFRQHYRALLYYGEYLRKIADSWSKTHTLVIPQWEWALGEGADILETLHYYVIGEPINLLAFFASEREMPFLYSGLVVLRVYLAGLFFMRFCCVVREEVRILPLVCGAIVYDFAFWSILNMARHPFFLTPLIFLPWLLTGVENIIRRRRWISFTAAVALAAISNFYFFYMLVFLTVIYTAVRLLPILVRNAKEALGHLLVIFLASACGALMAGVILLPMVMNILSNSRAQVDYASRLFYEYRYYAALPGMVFSGRLFYWATLGFSGVTFPAVCLLFMRKGRREMKTFYILSLLFLIFPLAGRFFNGMSYQANRWNFALAMLFAFTLVEMWDDMLSLRTSDSLLLIIALLVFGLMVFIPDQSRITKAMTSLAVIGVTLSLLSLRAGKGLHFLKEAGIILLAVLSVSANAFYFYAPTQENYVSEAVGFKRAMEIHDNEMMAVASASEGDTDFFRISGKGFEKNQGLTEGYSGTQYFWSIANPYLNELRAALSLTEPSSFNYYGSDDRSAALALASVKYYLQTAGTKSVPYGYEKKAGYVSSSGQEWTAYENTLSLPLAYGYRQSMSYETWQGLSPVEKEEALLTAAVIEQPFAGIPEASPVASDGTSALDTVRVPLVIEENSDDIVISDGMITVTKAGAGLKLVFEGLPDSENFVSFERLTFISGDTFSLYLGDDMFDPEDRWTEEDFEELDSLRRAQIRRSHRDAGPVESAQILMANEKGETHGFTYFTDAWSFYTGRSDYTANIGYSDEAMTTVSLTFGAVGVYSYDDLYISCSPKTRYADRIASLREGGLASLTVGMDRVEGRSASETDEVLVFAIPYSTGWRAAVDGVRTEVVRANAGYMAIRLPAGEHDVVLTYERPYGKAGVMLSLLGCFIFAGEALLTLYLRRGSKILRKEVDK